MQITTIPVQMGTDMQLEQICIWPHTKNKWVQICNLNKYVYGLIVPEQMGTDMQLEQIYIWPHTLRTNGYRYAT